MCAKGQRHTADNATLYRRLTTTIVWRLTSGVNFIAAIGAVNHHCDASVNKWRRKNKTMPWRLSREHCCRRYGCGGWPRVGCLCHPILFLLQQPLQIPIDEDSAGLRSVCMLQLRPLRRTLSSQLPAFHRQLLTQTESRRRAFRIFWVSTMIMRVRAWHIPEKQVVLRRDQIKAADNDVHFLLALCSAAPLPGWYVFFYTILWKTQQHDSTVFK